MAKTLHNSGAVTRTLSIPHYNPWLTCHHCEASCKERPLSKNEELQCSRCGSTVMTALENKTLQPSMALSISGLFILILANINPVLDFEVVGRLQAGYVITGVTELWHQGYGSLAFLVLFSGIVAPALYLAAICYVSTACCLRLPLPKVKTVFELVAKIEPWNLIPVYSIATVVAVVKLKMLGTVEWLPGARWILATAVLSLFCQQTFDRKLVIRRLRALGVWSGTTRE